jgi:hypothetical protein
MARSGRQWVSRKIAGVLVALALVTLGVMRWTSGPPAGDSAIRRVEPIATVAPLPLAEHRASATASPAPRPSPSTAPSPEGDSPTGPAVFDLATVAHQAAPQPTSDRDRFRTSDRFTAEDLAHPDRYFEGAARVPELQRDEERRDVLDYFLAYRAKLERDLDGAGRDAAERSAVLAVIGRYDAAIARLRSSLATPAPSDSVAGSTGR